MPTDAKILVVDDDDVLRELLVDTLATIGYTATAAVDGAAVMEMLKSNEFDLVISDVKMPIIDGITLLGLIRDAYPQMPVLLITGVASPEIVGEAHPDGFLAKPFRISHIEDMIEATLATGRKPD